MKKTIWGAIFFLMCVVAQAQNLTVTGTVLSGTDKEPIIGATVVETGQTTNGTITDFDGNFSLTVKQGASITVSYIGFKAQTLKGDRADEHHTQRG